MSPLASAVRQFLRQKMPVNQAINNNLINEIMRCHNGDHPCQGGGVATRLTADQLQPGSNPGLGLPSLKGLLSCGIVFDKSGVM